MAGLVLVEAQDAALSTLILFGVRLPVPTSAQTAGGRPLAAGLLLTASSAVVGLGWNVGFVGASAMVLECHRPEEKARVQSFDNSAVFGTMAFGSFLSGGLLTTYGWNTILWLALLPVLVGAAALATAARSRPKPAVG